MYRVHTVYCVMACVASIPRTPVPQLCATGIEAEL